MALGQDAWWRVVTGNQGKAGEAKKAGVQEGLPNSVQHSRGFISFQKHSVWRTIY